MKVFKLQGTDLRRAAVFAQRELVRRSKAEQKKKEEEELRLLVQKAFGDEIPDLLMLNGEGHE